MFKCSLYVAFSFREIHEEGHSDLGFWENLDEIGSVKIEFGKFNKKLGHSPLRLGFEEVISDSVNSVI